MGFTDSLNVRAAMLGAYEPHNPALVFILIGLLILAALGGLIWSRLRTRTLDTAFDELITRHRFDDVRDALPPVVHECLSDYYQALNNNPERVWLEGTIHRCLHRRQDAFDVYVAWAVAGGPTASRVIHSYPGRVSIVMVVVDGLPMHLPRFVLRPNGIGTRLVEAQDTNALPSRDALAQRNHVVTDQKQQVRALLLHGRPREVLMDNRWWHVEASDGTIRLYIEEKYGPARRPRQMVDDALRIASALRERLAELAD